MSLCSHCCQSSHDTDDLDLSQHLLGNRQDLVAGPVSSSRGEQTKSSKNGSKKDIDVQKLLKKSLTIELPLLTEAMAFAQPSKTNSTQTMIFESNATNACASLKKHAVDLIANVVYLVVSIVLAVTSPAMSEMSRSGQSNEASAGGGTFFSTDLLAAPNVLLVYWMIGAGCLSSTLLIIKNVRYIVSQVFHLFANVDGLIHTAIDTLKMELAKNVKEHLDEIVHAGHAGLMVEVAETTVANLIVFEIRNTIDEAEKEIPSVLEAMFPWPIRRRGNMFVSLAAPCFTIVWVKCILDLHWNSNSQIGGRRLQSFRDLEYYAQELEPMFVTLVVNAIVAILSSKPIIRYLVNSTIREIQKPLNSYIFNEVKENIPLPKIQSGLDKVSGLLRVESV